MRIGLRRAGRTAVLLLPLGLAACQSLIGPAACDGDGCPPLAARVFAPHAGPGLHEPKVTADPTMHALACDLDRLEKHIEWHGSVVAKVPDVWGQARLTQYRDDFEKIMEAQKGGFQETLQGSLARQDQAFFLNATAIAAAASGPGAVTTFPPGALTAPGADGKATSQPTMQVLNVPGATSLGGLTQTTLDKDGKPVAVKLADINDTFAPTSLKFSGNFKPGLVTKSADGKDVSVNISLEPAEVLAQQKRYLDFLNQLRRENEGDDTADSPGYSLNLIRVPVSVLPGKKTDEGYGAEITMTLSPVLGADLLPMTFRNLLQNDIQNQLGLPLTQVLGQDPADKGPSQLLTPEFGRYIRAVIRLNAYEADDEPLPGGGTRGLVRRCQYVEYLRGGSAAADADRKAIEKVEKDSPTGLLQYLADLGVRQFGPPAGGAATCPDPKAPAAAPPVAPATRKSPLANAGKVRDLVYLAAAGPAAPAGVPGRRPPSIGIPSLSFSNGLDNKTAFPISQILDVVGGAEAYAIAFGAYQALGQAFTNQGYAHLPDVQAYLREEVRAAYQFLEKNPTLWGHCNPHLVQAVRSQRWDDVVRARQQFRKEVALLTGSEPVDPGFPFDGDRDHEEFSRTTALAWCVVVDAALLTDRLAKDMRETATSKGRPLAGCDRWCPYFLPDPPAECRAAFNEYVKLRWPVRVFALDPYVQEQNLADRLSTRRELQLALSLAFSGGKINFNQLTRYARRLEAEYETIQLNRTQVGFGHGENTFGWRFYPRFQSPDTPGNLTVIGRDLLLGGPTRNQELRQRRLEPGVRECVAVVAMPAFVPYVTVDTASNWFPLPNPKHKALDAAQAVKLSRTVQAIKTGAGGVTNAACYRDGEFDRLARKAEQLEARLPLQTLTSPVPVLNTYGGFEMFANGTTDLAPELFGWYGAPGIDPDAPSTTLFLVGDHFSPLRTRVIVGNQAVVVDADPAKNQQRLLSRQVMQVTFASGAYPVTDEKGAPATVRVHVATPYGVTRELDIPVVKQKPVPVKKDLAPGFSFGPDAKLIVQYTLNPLVAPADAKLVTPSGCGSGNGPDGLKINWVSPAGTLTQRVKVAFEIDYPPDAAKPGSIKLPCVCAVVGEVKGQTVTVPKAALDCLATELVLQVAQLTPPFAREANPLDKGLKTKKVTITPLPDGPLVAQGAETTDQLVIEFKQVACCPPAGRCPPAMNQPAPPGAQLKPADAAPLAMPAPLTPGR